ncbi:A-kinase anchoring protein 12 L homeolog [Xenopus laevis]|uniref:A-kinase anchoring protein 12 L homeolog n=1 Tax=Xenopus laevis TaxID=8355 RepID=Q9DDN8_XENLA|nr:A-kinase anchoring protein 12 L homeolog [Xenopus laevis]AAG45105.1 gravin-like [Xenopus laevis]
MLGTITLTVVEEVSTPNEGPVENMEVIPSEATPKTEIKEQGQDEAPEATNATSESPEESTEQANETQSNEVGFKKVFKFVGFKFTVKKDKVEKSEPVQLLTVKQEKVEVNGTENHEKQNDVSGENVLETEDTKEVEKQSETDPIIQTSKTREEVSGEKPKSEEETKLEEEQVKTPESPTNPLVAETSSPLKKFFTQGWAGLRKKTSFRKSKEEDHQEVEKYIISEEKEKSDSQQVKEEDGENQIIVNGETLPKEANEIEESKACIDKETQPSAKELAKPEECPTDQLSVLKEDIKLENADICEVPVTESIQTSAEAVHVSVPTEVSEQKKEVDTTEDNDVNKVTVVSTSTATSEEVKEPLSEMAPDTEVICDKDNKDTDTKLAQTATLLESTEVEICLEPIMTETELLSSQEKAKLQGSPLRKLFSGSGLRKLSGKKNKGKKEDDTKAENTTEVPVSSDIPESDGDNTSPSSPEDSAETSPTEKGAEDATQAVETEGDGATSDGERKREGITPWASFKKLVTPKKRPKRPSESDKEEEVEKIKTSTMSSTDSAGSVENQEEAKENGEEQKLEKSTEENKKKVDNSVSWEALICVGSAKKRARKTSDSDDETQKNIDENKKIEEEVDKSKEHESEDPIVSSQEKEQVNDIPSPDQSTSPTEGDGGSTWQSFKRLVIPRRKSRTRAEEKTEETTAVSNTEQPTSDGETGKEEGWVSFKKLIPGRKKKKSDGKQEPATISDTGKSTEGCEAMEDDADVPAVVPLSEFDAAEQEKREAQQKEDTLNDVSKDEVKTPEVNSEGLIHAITVTVVEGERAVTSLEDRAPSWISANVTETVEQANELTEPNTKERIKSEITVEEAFIFGEVSQMVGSGNTIINEVELTSEALTALEEAIEYSCAEETTEMISAASQLDDSFTPAEEVTPIPEEDEGSQSLDMPEKQMDPVLDEATELTEQSILSLDKIQLNESISTSAEEHDTKVDKIEEANICISSKQDEESTIFSDERIEECTPVLAERHDPSELKSVVESNGADSVSVVEHIIEDAVIELVKERYLSSDQADIYAQVDTKEHPTDAVLLEVNREETSVGSVEVQDSETILILDESQADKIVDTAQKQSESILVLSEEKVEECAIMSEDHKTASVHPKCQFEVTSVSTEDDALPVKEQVSDNSISAVKLVDVAAEQTVEKSIPTLEQLKELSEEQSSTISVSTVHEEQVKEAALISDEQDDALPVKEQVLDNSISAVKLVDVAAEQTVEKSIPTLEQLKELSEEQSSSISVSTVHEEQVKEAALISDEQETIEHPHASEDVETKEGAAEEQVEEKSLIYEEVTESAQVEECSLVFAETQRKESVSILEEELARKSDPVEPLEQSGITLATVEDTTERAIFADKEETAKSVKIGTSAKAALNALFENDKHSLEDVSSEVGKQVSECSAVMFDEQAVEAAQSTEKEQVAKSPTPVATALTEEIASLVEEAVKEEKNAEYPHSETQISEIPSSLPIDQTKEVTTLAEKYDTEIILDETEKQAMESVSVLSGEQEVENFNSVVEEEVSKSAFIAGVEQTAESWTTASEEQTRECTTTADDVQAVECNAITVDEPSEEKPSATSLEHSAETVSVSLECPITAKEVQAEIAILVADEQVAEGVLIAVEEHTTESVGNVAGEKTEESAMTLPKESEEIVAFEDYDAESAPSLAEDQAGESALTTAEEQAESVCAALGQENETAISDSEVQIAAAVAEEQATARVTLSDDEQSAEGVTPAAELQIATGITLATVKDTTESAIFADEDETAKSVISVAEESISTAESISTVAIEQASESVSAVAVEHIKDIIITADAEEQIEENASAGEQSAEVTATLVEETATENASAALLEEATESASIVDSEPNVENAISTDEDLATDIATPAIAVQVSQDVITGSEEQTEQSAVSFTEALTAESVTTLAEETSTESTAAPIEEQADTSLTGVVDKQAEDNATTHTEEQVVEITANITKELSGESTLTEVEVQVIESASVKTEEQSSDVEQRVENDSAPDVYTAPVVTEKVATVLAEENTDESNNVLTFNADVDAPCSVDLNDVEQQEKNFAMTVEKTPEEMVDGRDLLANEVPQIVNETIPVVAEEQSMEKVPVNISEELTLDSVVLEGNLESTALQVPEEEVSVCKQENVPEPTIYSMPVEEQSATLPEDTVTEVTNIPEFESSEAIKACETVTTAAVQEQILAETVISIETSADTTEACETANDADNLSETSGALHTVVTVVQSVSQKAAAIVDAAIEAAASSLVVEAAANENTLEENIPENGVFVHEAVSVCTQTNANEDNLFQTTIISTVSVQTITETSVEKTEEIVQEIHTGDSVEHKHSLLVDETVPVSAQFTEEVVRAEKSQDMQETSEPVTVAISTGLHDGCVLQEEDKETTPVHVHEKSLKPADSECTEQVTVQITHTESESSMSINKPVEEEIVSQDHAELSTQADSQTVES